MFFSVSNPNLLELLVVTCCYHIPRIFKDRCARTQELGCTEPRRTGNVEALGVWGGRAVWKFLIPLIPENPRKFVAIFFGYRATVGVKLLGSFSN